MDWWSPNFLMQYSSFTRLDVVLLVIFFLTLGRLIDQRYRNLRDKIDDLTVDLLDKIDDLKEEIRELKSEE